MMLFNESASSAGSDYVNDETADEGVETGEETTSSKITAFKMGMEEMRAMLLEQEIRAVGNTDGTSSTTVG